MNRNSQAHFATTPTVKTSRSKFDRSFTNKTTFNAADLIPFYVDCGIMPGDTVKMNTASIVRMMTPITPVMDNANLDTYFFFVPYRLIWDHWQEFMGENKTEPWAQQTEYEIPQIIAPENGWTKGSLADYMGYPTKVGGYKASALPFRAYALIWNEWFRDQNLKNPCYISMGDADVNGKDITAQSLDYVTDVEKGAMPCKAAKYHDYFTSCLPEAQKGPAVNVPLGSTAPVIGNGKTLGFTDGTNMSGVQRETTNDAYNYNSSDNLGMNIGTTPVATGTFVTANKNIGIVTDPEKSGLIADLSQAVGATVNQLRQAFAIQKFYEKQALYGTRYIEMIKGHFGVTNPDFRMQRPEYLGGMQTPININQVVQTDATTRQLNVEYKSGSTTPTWSMSDLTPQGNTAAYSLTSGKNTDLFTHSFTEHGILMGLAVVRTVHTYQQGLNRQFSMKKFTDFYFPEFANLGNMPVFNKEIYLQNTDEDEEAFGYQEAWAHYRYFPDIVTGEMRSNYDQSLDVWHWADDYSELPSLGDEWIDETKENIQRTIAVQNHDQFFGDFYFQAIYTRPMPLYSVPGLIDHH